MEDDLTPEQKSVLDSLQDPDAPGGDNKYDFDKSIQQDILGLMAHERSFLVQSMHLIKSSYFVDRAHVLLCKILLEWFSDHVKKITAGGEDWIQEKYVLDRICEETKNNPAQTYYVAEVKTVLGSYVQGLTSRSYLMERVTNFAKDQEIRLAIQKTVDLVKSRDKEKHEKIRLLWDEALMVGPQMDLGLNYFEDIDERYLRMEKDREGKDRFSSGFEEIDNEIVGYGLSRGEIGAYQAMSGAGKTWMLCKSAINNVKRGHKVLFVTLEMNQDKTAERFDTLLGCYHMRDLLKQQDQVKKQINYELQKAIGALNRGITDKKRLVIKHFSAGHADINVVKAFYAQLAMTGFKPDALLLDYVGELKDFPGMKTYESRQRLVRDLRAFGVDENHCTFTAMQSNRSGRDKQEDGFIDDSEVGDSYGQVRVMDAVWSINQTKKEKMANVGRIFVSKHRNGKSRYHFCYSQNPNTLAIQTISDKTWRDEVSSVKEPKDDQSPMGYKDVSDKKFEPNRGEE